MLFTIVGVIATFTSTFSLIPQLYQTYKTKSTSDISFAMLVNFIICSVSWVIYGLGKNATSVWITNIIMTICSCFLLILKLRYDQKKE